MAGGALLVVTLTHRTGRRIMIPLLRASGPSPLWKNLSHILPALSRVATFSTLLCHNRLSLCGAAATSFRRCACAVARRGYISAGKLFRQELVSKSLSARACQQELVSKSLSVRAVSSVGRASALHAEGRRFETFTAHQPTFASQAARGAAKREGN